MPVNPSTGTCSVLGVSSITLNWNPKGSDNPTGTLYRAQISSCTGFACPMLPYVTQSSSATFSGLVSNASYYLQVSALNLSGIAAAPVSLGTALTLPAAASTATAGTFSGIMTDGFTLNWSANGNSSLTIYNIEASTAGDFNSSASSVTASVQGLTHTFTDLALDTTYWVRIQSRGQAGAAADFLTAGSTKTLLSNVANALVTRDNTVTLQTSYGLISVLMPFGSLGGSTRIAIKPESSFQPPASSVSAMRPTGVGLEITAFPSVLILSQITINLPYKPEALPEGIDRSRLVLALYDNAKSLWVPLPAVSDTVNNIVTAQTWHLSTFQIMEMPTQISLKDVRIYPNPFRPSSISGVMHFDNLPPYATVKLYTFLGELVRDLSADVNGTTYWDGDNASGRKAASGVYIALLKTQDKKSKKVVKVVIER
jgi:chitodextrinase